MSDDPGATAKPLLMPWSKGVAPRYIALFLLIVFYDQLAVRTLAVGGLGPAAMGATIGGVLAFLLLFYAPAMWGLRARLPLEGVAAATFGERGARWIPGALTGLAMVVWYAVTLTYAVDLALRSLATFGLLDARHLDPISWRGLTLAGPLFLWVAVAWSIASALIGTLAFRLTAAVMAGYQAFPALVLGLVAVWAIPGAAGFRPLGYDPVTAEAIADPSLFAFTMMVQLVFGFSATFGAMAADWGAVSRGEDDVRLGGLVGVAIASTVLTTLALLIVAGANGREPPLPGLKNTIEAQGRTSEVLQGRGIASSVEAARQAVRQAQGSNFTVREILRSGVRGVPGGIGLIILDLALLGPACFAPFVLGRRMSAALPALPAWAWSLVGAVATWPLVALRLPNRIEPVFGLLGALFAPVVGAMAADAARHRGAWPGPRRGLNLAGLAAWFVGLAVGLVPLVGPPLGLPRWSAFQPASVFAFFASFVTYFSLALAGLEPPKSPASDPSPTPPEAAPSPPPLAADPDLDSPDPESSDRPG